MKTCQVRLEKKDEYPFENDAAVALILFQIIEQYVDIICAKFDSDKVKQKKIREVLAQTVQARSPKWPVWHSLAPCVPFDFYHVQDHIVHCFYD